MFSRGMDNSVYAFMASELRDIRKGMEGRDAEIRGELGALKNVVSELARSVTSSQHNVREVREDMETLVKDVRAIRGDVDGLIEQQKTAVVRAEAVWTFPKAMLAVFIGLGAIGGAILSIYTAIPIVVEYLN
jgi:ElaB/YqjD/DUF883 family membrane-anchored ribosome-binding protein